MTRKQPEEQLVRRALVELSRIPNVSLFRNPVGTGYLQRIAPELYRLAERGADALHRGYASVLYRNRITYGLGTGSPDVVGHISGAFVGLEFKRPGGGRLGDDQREWHRIERAKGMHILSECRSIEEARAFLLGVGS